MKIITVHQVKQFRLSSPYNQHLSLQRQTLANGLIKRTLSILDQIESKTLHKDQEGDRWRKKK